MASDSRPQPLPPSKDPWYNAPEGFESTPPGTILRIRPTPGDLPALIGNMSAGYNILFRTTDSLSHASWAVTTVLIPTTFFVSPLGKTALLSYQFAYNTCNLDSSPSYGLHNRQSVPNTDLGWVVNTPDFEGPKAAFGATLQAGRATLDSIRAWWQLQYAPELEISGTALGGLFDDLVGNMDRVNCSPIAALVVSGLIGMTTQYPEAAAHLRSRLRPDMVDEFLRAKDTNVNDSLRFYAMKDIYSSYLVGGAADLQHPVIQKVFNLEGHLGRHGIPNMPMFIYMAVGDQFSPISQTDALVGRFCAAGADITYERNTVGGHLAEIENGNERAIAWLRTIFDESYVPSPLGGMIRDVAVDISPLTA
ncbi:LIP-domain-containing protein [Astrocystis sublimbata]|nr:LIP-domain-containing protein [Astrocystis sublimbata]